MNLRRLERRLSWPETVTSQALRGWVCEQLSPEGELLRWAITSVERDVSGSRWLQVEAVVLP